MTWDIYIQDGHPSLAKDRLSLTATVDGITRALALSNAGYHRIQCDEVSTKLADVVAAIQSFGPPEPIREIKQAPVPTIALSLVVEEVAPTEETP